MNSQEWSSVKMALLTRPGKSNCAITMLMRLLCLTTDTGCQKEQRGQLIIYDCIMKINQDSSI